MNRNQALMVLRKLEQLEAHNKTMRTQISNLNDQTMLQAKRIRTLGDENTRLRDRVERAELMTERLIRIRSNHV